MPCGITYLGYPGYVKHTVYTQLATVEEYYLFWAWIKRLCVAEVFYVFCEELLFADAGEFSRLIKHMRHKD